MTGKILLWSTLIFVQMIPACCITIGQILKQKLSPNEQFKSFLSETTEQHTRRILLTNLNIFLAYPAIMQRFATMDETYIGPSCHPSSGQII